MGEKKEEGKNVVRLHTNHSKDKGGLLEVRGAKEGGRARPPAKATRSPSLTTTCSRAQSERGGGSSSSYFLANGEGRRRREKCFLPPFPSISGPEGRLPSSREREREMYSLHFQLFGCPRELSQWSCFRL